jgi:cell cycle checkpoint control protein RAD9A
VPADDDRQWDVAEDDEAEAEAEDMLGWDASADLVGFQSVFVDGIAC